MNGLVVDYSVHMDLHPSHFSERQSTNPPLGFIQRYQAAYL